LDCIINIHFHWKSSKNDLFKIRNQFPFTQYVSIDFIDNTGEISFNSTSNIQYIGVQLNVIVQHSKSINSTILQKNIVCKLGNITLPTVVVSNGYSCNLSSTIPGVQNLSLWYNGSDTINGEFMVSSNSLPVIFVGKTIISLNHETPFHF
jgi:hypothetical protein